MEKLTKLYLTILGLWLPSVVPFDSETWLLWFQHYWTKPIIETLIKQNQFIYVGTRSTSFVGDHKFIISCFLATYDPKLQVDNQFKWELGSQIWKQELWYLTHCENYKKGYPTESWIISALLLDQKIYKHWMNKNRANFTRFTSIADNHVLLFMATHGTIGAYVRGKYWTFKIIKSGEPYFVSTCIWERPIE